MVSAQCTPIDHEAKVALVEGHADEIVGLPAGRQHLAAGAVALRGLACRHILQMGIWIVPIELGTLNLITPAPHLPEPPKHCPTNSANKATDQSTNPGAYHGTQSGSTLSSRPSTGSSTCTFRRTLHG